MSIPSSKILKTSKSILAIADLKHNSPTTTQNTKHENSLSSNQNVNIVVSGDKVAYPKVDLENHEENPYNHSDGQDGRSPEDQRSEPEVMTRSLNDALQKTEEISETLEDKENVIKALTLIIEILQSNPLIVNKYVVAEEETLAELIRLMTNSEAVEIDTSDVECSCLRSQYKIIKRIYITKDNEVYSISQCPVLFKLFDNYRISLNLVI